jgi:hypothetical protein
VIAADSSRVLGGVCIVATFIDEQWHLAVRLIENVHRTNYSIRTRVTESWAMGVS